MEITAASVVSRVGSSVPRRLIESISGKAKGTAIGSEKGSSPISGSAGTAWHTVRNRRIGGVIESLELPIQPLDD